MLAEGKHVRQVTGEPFRRWFSDEDFDLIVWYDDRRSIIGFQLCYEVSHAEYALTWSKDSGFKHNRVDEGEDRGGGRMKMTPILVADGQPHTQWLAERFEEAGGWLEPQLVEFIRDKILECAL